MEEPNYRLEEELIEAARVGDIAKVSNLIAKGVNVNTHRNALGMTPLHLAAMIGFPQLVELLIKAGADVNEEDFLKNTPLHLAAYNGEERVCEILLKAGAKVNVRSVIEQMTPLHLATLKANYEVVELLLDHDADPYAKDIKGRTPIDLANPPTKEVILRKLEERKRFIKGMMNVDEDKLFADWIQNAAEMCEIKEERVDIGGAMLLFAAHENKKEIAKTLLKLGVNPNIQDKDGMTPLHHAVINSNEELISALKEAGADTEIKDNSGMRPFDYLKSEKG